MAVLKRQLEVANRKQRHLYDEIHEANNANEQLHKQVLEMQQAHKTETSTLREQISEAKHSREADRTQFKVSYALGGKCVIWCARQEGLLLCL